METQRNGKMEKRRKKNKEKWRKNEIKISAIHRMYRGYPPSTKYSADIRHLPPSTQSSLDLVERWKGIEWSNLSKVIGKDNSRICDSRLLFILLRSKAGGDHIHHCFVLFQFQVYTYYLCSPDMTVARSTCALLKKVRCNHKEIYFFMGVRQFV